MISASTMTAWLRTYGLMIEEAVDELNRLDAALGDGDFGTSIQRGLDAVVTSIDASEQSVSAVLTYAGRTIVSTIGGTSGPLVGSFFLRAGASLDAASECTPAEFAAALGAGADAVMELGGAALGDKTMVDALVPAIGAFTSAASHGPEADAASAAAVAAQAAHEAAEATAGLAARRGRASYVGNGGTGHVDPGAMGVSILFAALADVLSGQVISTTPVNR